MITSQIALLLNGRYEHLTPDTHIDSLYIEKLENISDSSVLVRRYSVYKHFPIAVNKENIVNSLSQEYVAFKYDGSTINIPQYNKLLIGHFSQYELTTDNDLKIARLSKNTNIVSSAQRHLLKLDIDRVNLSFVLYNYIGKSEFTTTLNDLIDKFDTSITICNSSVNNLNTSILSLDASVNRLNVSTNDLETHYYNVSANLDELKQNVKDLWKNILDTSLYSFDKTNNRPWTTNNLRFMIGRESLEPGCRYLMHYNPTGGYGFTIMLIAVSKNQFAKKVYGIPYSVTKDLFGSNYCNSHYEKAKIEKWDLRYTLVFQANECKITFMRDEWGNEAPFDFKSYKLFKNTNNSDNVDMTTWGCIRNNIICSSINIRFVNPDIGGPSQGITNNYIGYNNTFVSSPSKTDEIEIKQGLCNNYIGNNNTSVYLQDSLNCYIGNNNIMPYIHHGDSCKIGDDTYNVLINSYNSSCYSSLIDSSCSNITIRGSYIHVYQNCHNILLNTKAKNINIYPSNTSISHDSTKSLENVNIHYVKTENTSLYFNSNVSNYDAFCAETLGPTNLSNSFYFDGTIYADGLYEES